MKKDWLAIKNKPGFSLMEAIVAVAIFSIITTSIAATYINVSGYILSSGVETQAVFLAEEGLEATRNIRDNDFLSLNNGSHGISSSGDEWNFSGSSDTTGIYTRQITISDASDSDTKEVSSQIDWSYKGESKTLTLSREFSDWGKIKPKSFSWWPFDENSGCDAHDEEGDNDGTLEDDCPNTSPDWDSSEKHAGDSSLEFSGKNGGYAEAPDDDSLDLATEGSIMAWIRPTAKKASQDGIIYKGEESNLSDQAYYLRMESDRDITGGGRASSNQEFNLRSNTSISRNSWSHVAFVWDGDGMRIYINGNLDRSSNTVLDARNSSGALRFGFFRRTNNNFVGQIDEVRVYPTALSDQEILDIYNL